MHELEIASKVLREAKKAGATEFIEVEVGELSEITSKELEEGLIKISSNSLDIPELKNKLEHHNKIENHEHKINFKELEEHGLSKSSWLFNVIPRESKIQCTCSYKGKANILDRGHGYCLFNCPKCGSSGDAIKVLDGGEIKIISIS